MEGDAVINGCIMTLRYAISCPDASASVGATTAILYILDRYSGSVRLEASSPSLQDLLDEYGLD